MIKAQRKDMAGITFFPADEHQFYWAQDSFSVSNICESIFLEDELLHNRNSPKK